MATQRECIAAYLKANSWREIPSRSTKYLVFAEDHATHLIHYFVGKSGGLRHGKTVTESFSVPDTRRNLWVNEGRKILAEKP